MATVDLDDVERWLRTCLKSYYVNPRYEDGLQEGLIRAWRDNQDSVERDRKHILNRARQWATAYIQKTHARPTGAPSLSRDGIGTAEGDRKLEKVRGWVDDFQSLHDRQPTNVEVADGTGLPRHRVQAIRQKLREGKYNHAHYREDSEGHRRLAESYFSEVHIESLAQSRNGDAGEDASRVELLEDPFKVDDEVISRLDFENLLKQIEDDETRYVIYLRFVMGYTVTEIGEALGMNYPNSNGARKLRRAVDEVKKILDPEPEKVFDPYTGSCKKGHKRTPETIRYVEFEDGRYRRDCLICEEARIGRYQKKPKERVPDKLCKRGHEIDGVRKSGARYCRTCNMEGNARRKKEKAKK